jgi:nitrile hydratase
MAEVDHDPLHIPLEDHEETYYEKRIIALSNLLMDKGIITAQELLDVLKEGEEQDPSIGARVIARAWLDADFKQRLLKNGKEALGEMGIAIPKRLQNVQVVENTDSVHYLAVCTLCSCYPIPLLGPPPEWYKSEVYRSRAVREPRAVLREFGLEIDDRVEVRVVDATAEVRYLVLPRRPAGTGNMGEEALAALVTRDSMIGTGEVPGPSP